MKFSIKEDQGPVVQVAITGCLVQSDIAPPLDLKQALFCQVFGVFAGAHR